METFKLWVEIGSNIAVGLTAIVVAIVGVVGLNQWRAQLRGNKEYEVALRVLKSVLMVRDTIKTYRSPFNWSGEFADRQRGEGEKVSEADVLDKEYAKRKHLIEVQKAASEFHLARLESEALWGRGNSVYESLEPVHRCVSDIFVAHELYFQWALEEAQGQDVDKEVLADERRLVDRQGSNDEYSKALESAVKQCEDAFRVYLK